MESIVASSIKEYNAVIRDIQRSYSIGREVNQFSTTMSKRKMKRSASTAGLQLKFEDDHDIVKRKLEAMKKALNIDLVVLNIVENMDFLGLKAVRSVNKLWKKEATKQLSTRNCSQVSINFCRLVTMSDNTKLTTLSELLDKSTNFPCNSFKFTFFNNWNPSIDFFKIHGHKIKTLTLNFIGGFTFREILLPHVPNLVVIDFNYCSSVNSTAKLKLPHLKFISYSRSSGSHSAKPFPLHILGPAINLEGIKSSIDSNLDLEVVSKAGKVPAIKTLWLCDTSTPETLNTLVRSGLKLDKLEFAVDSTTTMSESSINSFQNILTASSATLKVLKVRKFYELLHRIQFPKFEKVHSIVVSHYWDYDSTNTQIFPNKINLQDTFPHLRVLDFSGGYLMSQNSSKMSWQNIFPLSSDCRGNLKSVTTLILGVWTDEFWMRELHVLCPNFDTLVLSVSDNTRSGFRLNRFFTNVMELWSHLKRIRLDIGMWSNEINLDSVFTGVSEVELKKSFQSLEGPQWTELEKVRCKPSIIDFKELQTLKIWIQNFQIAKESNLKLTQVSGCAFQQLPNLKASIYYRHSHKEAHYAKSVLDSIAPFVNIQDEYFLAPKYDYNDI